METQSGGNVAEPGQARALLAEARRLGLARLDAELLLAALLRVNRAQLLAFDERSVGPGVLVPRPETELLVELCLARLDETPRRVADLGTGSGAIALALARERP